MQRAPCFFSTGRPLSLLNSLFIVPRISKSVFLEASRVTMRHVACLRRPPTHVKQFLHSFTRTKTTRVSFQTKILCQKGRIHVFIPCDELARRSILKNGTEKMAPQRESGLFSCSFCGAPPRSLLLCWYQLFDAAAGSDYKSLCFVPAQ